MQQYHTDDDFYLHQDRLIRYISYDLIIVSAIVSTAYAFKQLWYLTAVVGMGGLLVILNLLFLRQNRNKVLASHGLILIIFLTITSANYLVWGIGPTFSYWFYLIPLLAAASLVAWQAIIIYSTVALIMILAFSLLSIPPFYQIPPRLLYFIEIINHLFAYLITVTIVVHLIVENNRFQQVLYDQNHLLQVERDKYLYLAHYDQLTDLPNRQYFKQKLQAMIESNPANHCVTVFFMDLDNLKEVNDRLGHDAGDELLVQSARRLKDCFSQDDFIARLGGDEFTAILLHQLDDDIHEEVANKIIQAFDKAFTLSGHTHHCSISIGIANFPKDSQSVKQLMVKADLAMYDAKKIKGSSYQCTQ